MLSIRADRRSESDLLPRRNGTRVHEPIERPPLTVLLGKYSERVRRKKGKTQAQIARDAWLADSYVSRLLSGDRLNPSRDALVLLGCWGLELSVEETDELLLSADYKPLVLPASIR